MDDPDRPAITTARLDGLFEGLRGELNGLRVPDPEVLVCRAVRRRRWRRFELVFMAGVVASAGAWSVCAVTDGGAGAESTAMVGPASVRTLSPTLLLPGPEQVGGPVDQVMPVGATGDRLLLDRDQLPVSPGRYGPWGTQAVAASVFALPIVQGCAPGVVNSLGASRRWELLHEDPARANVTAVQYLLEFDAEEQAAEASTRLLGAAECSTWQWVPGGRADRALALGSLRWPGRVEEFTTRVSGRQLAVLMVQYWSDGPAEAAVLDQEFLSASEQFSLVGTGQVPRGPTSPG
ncbi:hypothetical protein [Kitasatospora sp. NPDC002040]|uniref:hypothetical protein n=1 Tax=Kitasatospora sp. NPDC002040 TaxID=3154661 RepID=UPI0033248A89